MHRRETGAPVWQYSKVTPQLYVGGQHTIQGYAEMREFGITAIVNMREARYSDVKQGIGGERHLHLPTVDHTPPSVDDLMRGVAFISEEISSRENAKVYIHCAAGCGRAPTMAAAYLVSTGRRACRSLETNQGFPPLHQPDRHAEARPLNNSLRLGLIRLDQGSCQS